MWNRKRSVTLSLVVCFVVCAVLTAGLFVGPWAVKMWFHIYRGWSENGEAMERMLVLFKVCFYPCACLGFVTLYSLIRLLLNIKKDAIFIPPNVKYLRRISWCCIVVSLITLAAGILYIPYLFVSVAAGFMGLMLRVVKNVMENAVQLKEENELTI
jgi:hypothetical protein